LINKIQRYALSSIIFLLTCIPGNPKTNNSITFDRVETKSFVCPAMLRNP
jgi:hypothetical protein